VNTQDKVAVCSRSFSRDPALREALLARYANVTFNDAGQSLSGDGLVAFLEGHNKAITALEKIDESILARLPDLEVIGKYGVGLDMIDLDAMARLGKRIGWTGGVNKRSVAELVVSFAIAMLRHVPAAHREVLSGTWRQHVGGQLSGRTVGIVGCGHVGKEVVRLLKPFGCPVIAHDIVDYAEFYAAEGVRAVSLDELIARSDVITLHVPHDASTHGMIGRAQLAAMKPGSVLVNCARGGIVDEVALKDALRDGPLASAAFDVFASEPPTDTELLHLPNFLATPHIGGSAREAIFAMGMAAIEGLDDHALPEPGWLS
jgi:phosphoglycerate dehydrogenase-like enzyme